MKRPFFIPGIIMFTAKPLVQVEEPELDKVAKEKIDTILPTMLEPPSLEDIELMDYNSPKKFGVDRYLNKHKGKRYF